MTLPVSYDSQTPLEYVPPAGSVWFHDTDLLLSSDSVALSGSHDQKARAHIKLVERARANRVQIPARASLFSSNGFRSYYRVAPEAVPYARVKRLQWDKPAFSYLHKASASNRVLIDVDGASSNKFGEALIVPSEYCISPDRLKEQSPPRGEVRS